MIGTGQRDVPTIFGGIPGFRKVEHFTDKSGCNLHIPAPYEYVTHELIGFLSTVFDQLDQ
jgi:hypothetical protein